MLLYLGLLACSTAPPSAVTSSSPPSAVAPPSPVQAAAQSPAPEPVAAPSVPLSFSCTEQALAATHPDTLRIYRNEVFARHGRPFASEDLREIFGRSAWYRVDSTFTEDRLTNADRDCVARIASVAERTGKQGMHVQSPDLDGDGKGERVQWDGSTLTIGSVSKQLVDPSRDEEQQRVSLHGDTIGIPFRPARSTAPLVDVIDLDVHDGLRELVVVTHPGVSDEWQFTVVRFVQGEIQPLMEPTWLDQANYRVEPGRLRHDASNCGQSFTLTFTLDEQQLTKQVETKGTYDAGRCAACPFVVRLGPNASMAGEILRNQSSEADEREDVLPLGHVESGAFTIRLLELKPETTYLDRLVLRVAGQEIRPSTCEHLCNDDGLYTLIDSGESIDVQFDVPIGGHAELAADGFYLPYEPVDEGLVLRRAEARSQTH